MLVLFGGKFVTLFRELPLAELHCCTSCIQWIISNRLVIPFTFSDISVFFWNGRI